MDKIDRLFDAMEHPEHYSQVEIETMLRDQEVKGAFDLLYKIKSSLQSIDTPDIEEEWAKFVKHHRKSERSRHSWLPRFFSRNAVACIAICIVSFTAVAAIVGMGIYRISNGSLETTTDVELTTGTGIVTSQPDTVRIVDTEKGLTPEIIVFDDETLETIMNRTATYYGYNVIFNNHAAKSLRLYFRWNQALPIDDIVESLNNFEQITLTINDKTIKID